MGENGSFGFVSLNARELFQNKWKPWLKAKVSKEKWKAGHVVSACLNSKFVPPIPGKVTHTSDLSPGAIAAKGFRVIFGYMVSLRPAWAV